MCFFSVTIGLFFPFRPLLHFFLSLVINLEYCQTQIWTYSLYQSRLSRLVQNMYRMLRGEVAVLEILVNTLLYLLDDYQEAKDLNSILETLEIYSILIISYLLHTTSRKLSKLRVGKHDSKGFICIYIYICKIYYT